MGKQVTQRFTIHTMEERARCQEYKIIELLLVLTLTSFETLSKPLYLSHSQKTSSMDVKFTYFQGRNSQLGAILFHKTQLDIFSCHNWLVQGGAASIQWAFLEVRDAVKHPTIHRTTPLPKMISTEVEKHSSRGQTGYRHCEEYRVWHQRVVETRANCKIHTLF